MVNRFYNLDIWKKESGIRLQGSHSLDFSKVQAPCVVNVPTGGYRLYYTAVGPGKPIKQCQGYILSAFSEDGLQFESETGIRLEPQAEIEYMSRRILAPTVTQISKSRWRMYFESRGTADVPTVICSAVSTDMLNWELEGGIRLQGFSGVGGPRFVSLPDGRCRLYCFATEWIKGLSQKDNHIRKQCIISAVSKNGLRFEMEDGYRICDKQNNYDTAGLTAAEVIPPLKYNNQWTMFFSAWQDVPDGTNVPLHPAFDLNDDADNFAKASIAADISGYRSRIFKAISENGLDWKSAECVIQGGGYESDEVDAVHAEDMSLIKIDLNQYRMYYAACDRIGNWRILSAVSEVNS